MIALETNI